MRVFIITMEDPLYTVPLIKEIVEKRKEVVVGVAITKGDRLKIGKKKSKLAYLLALLLIMGLFPFFRNVYITICYKVCKKVGEKFPFVKDDNLAAYARNRNIKVFEINNPNDPSFLVILKDLQPDVVINQSQNILKAELLKIPTMGVVNRHNALLPKNRGRLTPFWVLFKGEKETGVSIHLVTEGIDDGPIIVQERYQVNRKDTFNTLVKKNYKLASVAMLKALDKLESGESDFLDNDQQIASYNTIPTLREALKYRLSRLTGILTG